MPGGWDGIGVAPELLEAVTEQGWLFPRDVQDEAIPLILGGGDVMVAAATGSGKTGAFGLPIVQTILEQRRYESRPAPKVDEAAAAKAVAAKAVTLSKNDRDSIAVVLQEGLVCKTTHPRFWGGVRGTKSVKAGKYFYEVTMIRGLGRVGFSTAAATLELGIDAAGFGYGGTAKKSNSRRFDPYGETFGNGDVLGCYVDMDRKEIGFTKNGKDMGVAFKLPKNFQVCLKNAEVRVNFGAESFEYPPPLVGYKPLHHLAIEHTGTSAENARVRKRQSSGSGGGGKVPKKTPIAIIIAPTKELAEQIFKDVKGYAARCQDPPIIAELLMGGVNFKKATNTLQRGCDLVVGTPATVLDFARSKKLNVRNVALFCLDEADQLCDHETQKSILSLFNLLPKGGAGMERLQVCFFSATLHSPQITRLAEQICHNPTWVDLKGEDAVPDTVHHVFINVDPKVDSSWKKGIPQHVVVDDVHTTDDLTGPQSVIKLALSEGIKRLKPVLLKRIVDEFQMEQCIIFCRTNLDCDNLEKFLTAVGGGQKFCAGAKMNLNKYSCAVLAGMRDNHQRRANLEAFQKGECRFLICTDVAARGIDVKKLPYVINMTLPDKPENYVHRIGRVGRADHIGLAISLVSTVEEKVWYYDKRKWRGKKLSTALAHIDKNGTPTGGGCCTWYDEPKLFEQVQKIVGSPIPSLVTSPDGKLCLPPEVAAKIKTGASFGEQVGGDSFAKTISGHLDVLQQPVERLADMEVQAQSAFLIMSKSNFF